MRRASKRYIASVSSQQPFPRCQQRFCSVCMRAAAAAAAAAASEREREQEQCVGAPTTASLLSGLWKRLRTNSVRASRPQARSKALMLSLDFVFSAARSRCLFVAAFASAQSLSQPANRSAGSRQAGGQCHSARHYGDSLGRCLCTDTDAAAAASVRRPPSPLTLAVLLSLSKNSEQRGNHYHNTTLILSLLSLQQLLYHIYTHAPF